MREEDRPAIKRIASQARSLDRALRDIVLPLGAAAVVVAIAAFSAAPRAAPAPHFDRFHEDPRDFTFSFLVFDAAARSTQVLP